MIKAIKELKILILLSYFNRPILVKNALQSVKNAVKKHHRWELAFGDDGSEYPGEPIAREILSNHQHKLSFYNTHSSIEDKIQNGIQIGKLANQVLSKTDCDICVTLCDDDEFHPDYLWNLNLYFLQNPEVMYCWSNIHLFNPFKQKAEGINNLSGIYNELTESVNPYGRLDGSQVAFQIKAIREHNIWYRDTTKSNGGEHAWSYNLDGELFKQFYNKFGSCPYTGFVAQYKGVHERQLVYQKEHIFKDKKDMEFFHKETIRLAGKEF